MKIVNEIDFNFIHRSYGILLWEIMTFGENPYHNINTDVSFILSLVIPLCNKESLTSHNDLLLFKLIRFSWESAVKNKKQGSNLSTCLLTALMLVNSLPLNIFSPTVSVLKLHQMYTQFLIFLCRTIALYTLRCKPKNISINRLSEKLLL